jgi:hypothetical protein
MSQGSFLERISRAKDPANIPTEKIDQQIQRHKLELTRLSQIQSCWTTQQQE